MQYNNISIGQMDKIMKSLLMNFISSFPKRVFNRNLIFKYILLYSSFIEKSVS